MTIGNKSMLFSRSLVIKGFSILGIAVVFSACGGDKCQGTGCVEESVDAEEFISNKTITGVSQKGPFINGSSVSVQELDEMTLAQTGKTFKGKITNDRGEFSVSNVTLASRYALLEANGYYRNEVTGKKSVAPILLNAVVDLSDRDQVNINLLTHLEYERVLYLVNTGMNVNAAKKQAESEIFKAFGIDGEFESSEDLNIFATGDGNAALLAISILLQGNLSEAELSERLANFARDIEEDGEWNDDSTRMKIADWVRHQHLEQVRSNVEGWNLGPVPEFEKFVKIFEKYLSMLRNEKLELGECLTLGEVKLGSDGNRYICRDDSLWVGYGQCGEVLWCGLDFDYRVKTGFGEESDNHGYWHEVTDWFDGGLSEFVYPVSKDASSSNAEMIPIIDACEGLCGTGSLDKGTLTYDPSLGLKFYLSNDSLMENDVSSWNGICIVYKANLLGSIEIAPNWNDTKKLGYDLPFVQLPKTTDIKTKDFLWEDFKQAGWGDAKMSGMEVAKQMSSIAVKWQAKDGTDFDFKIVAIGKYGTCKE